MRPRPGRGKAARRAAVADAALGVPPAPWEARAPPAVAPVSAEAGPHVHRGGRLRCARSGPPGGRAAEPGRGGGYGRVRGRAFPRGHRASGRLRPATLRSCEVGDARAGWARAPKAAQVLRPREGPGPVCAAPLEPEVRVKVPAPPAPPTRSGPRSGRRRPSLARCGDTSVAGDSRPGPFEHRPHRPPAEARGRRAPGPRGSGTGVRAEGLSGDAAPAPPPPPSRSSARRSPFARLRFPSFQCSLTLRGPGSSRRRIHGPSLRTTRRSRQAPPSCPPPAASSPATLGLCLSWSLLRVGLSLFLPQVHLFRLFISTTSEAIGNLSFSDPCPTAQHPPALSASL